MENVVEDQRLEHGALRRDIQYPRLLSAYWGGSGALMGDDLEEQRRAMETVMMAVKQVQMGALMRDVLGESYVSLELRGVDYEDGMGAGRSSLVAVVVDTRTGVERRVSGEGVGLVSVAFNALVETFIDEYPSLENLRFHAFSLEDTTKIEQGSSRSESQKTAHFSVYNQVGYTFRFTATSQSVTTSCLQVTLAAVEYFVNSELSFVRVRGFLDDAKVKNRPDLVERYTQMLTLIVMNSLYSGSIEK